MVPDPDAGEFEEFLVCLGARVGRDQRREIIGSGDRFCAGTLPSPLHIAMRPVHEGIRPGRHASLTTETSCAVSALPSSRSPALR